MTQSTSQQNANSTLFLPDLRQTAILALALAGAIIASMVLIEWVQRTVARYHPLAFEEAARQAIDNGEHGLAVNICTGNLLYAQNRFPSYGLARLLRAKAHFGLGDLGKAEADLAAAEGYWRKFFRHADAAGRTELKDLAMEMGMASLGSGDAPRALQLFSLAATGSGEPVAYAAELRESLSVQMRAHFWPDEDYLLVEDFHRPDAALFETWTDATGRSIEISRIAVSPAKPGDSTQAMRMAAGPASRNGMSWYGVPFYMQLPEKPCRFRARLLCKKGPLPKLILGHYYPDTGSSDVTIGSTPVQLTGDSYVAEAVLPAQRPGQSPGCLVRIGLILPMEEAEYIVTRIELLPGNGKDFENHGQD